MFGNWLKTAILMAGIVALFGVVGGAIGGQSGLLLGLLFAGAINLFAYWNSDKLVLRLYNAQEVDASSAPQLYRMVTGGGITSLFSTHPQTEERVARLLQMARGA